MTIQKQHSEKAESLLWVPYFITAKIALQNNDLVRAELLERKCIEVAFSVGALDDLLPKDWIDRQHLKVKQRVPREPGSATQVAHND